MNAHPEESFGISHAGQNIGVTQAAIIPPSAAFFRVPLRKQTANDVKAEMLQIRKGLGVGNAITSELYLAEIKGHNLSSEKEARKLKIKEGSDKVLKIKAKKAALRTVRMC